MTSSRVVSRRKRPVPPTRGNAARLTPRGMAKPKSAWTVHLASLRNRFFDHIDATATSGLRWLVHLLPHLRGRVADLVDQGRPRGGVGSVSVVTCHGPGADEPGERAGELGTVLRSVLYDRTRSQKTGGRSSGRASGHRSVQVSRGGQARGVRALVRSSHGDRTGQGHQDARSTSATISPSASSSSGTGTPWRSSSTPRTLANSGGQSLRRDWSPANSLVSRAPSSERSWLTARSVSLRPSCRCRHRRRHLVRRPPAGVVPAQLRLRRPASGPRWSAGGAAAAGASAGRMHEHGGHLIPVMRVYLPALDHGVVDPASARYAIRIHGTSAPRCCPRSLRWPAAGQGPDRVTGWPRPAAGVALACRLVSSPSPNGKCSPVTTTCAGACRFRR